MLSELEAGLGYTFRDKSILENALTHSSYANENRERGLHDNERLEFLGDSILGFGVALSVVADVMFNAGEGFVKALSDVTEKNFGNVKIAFDIFSVALSVVLSLALFGGAVAGVREGTLIAALGTGLAVKFFTARPKTPLDRVLSR